MRPLGDCVRVTSVGPQSSEDILDDSIAIYPDRCRNLHGDPGSEVIYTSLGLGDIRLKLPNTEEQKDHFLFAHYLWNASLQLAELISHTAAESSGTGSLWSVENLRVLEVGAGCGLTGIVSALAGAQRVCISDHPSPAILEIINENVGKNLQAATRSAVSAVGHSWGQFDDEFSKTYTESFDTILCADCLWMEDQHSNLISSFHHFLTHDSNARVFIVAGFHTGRDIVYNFFSMAAKGSLVAVQIWEQDTHGNTREYDTDRLGFDDDIEERRNWQVIACLKRS